MTEPTVELNALYRERNEVRHRVERLTDELKIETLAKKAALSLRANAEARLGEAVRLLRKAKRGGLRPEGPIIANFLAGLEKGDGDEE